MTAADAQPWLEKLAHLKPSGTGGHYWPPITHSRDPGKPLLLLALMDRLSELGSVSEEIQLDQLLRDRFELYSESVLGAGVQPPSINSAFHGLAEDGLWQLTEGLNGAKQAILEPGLRPALADRDCRQQLREALYEANFAPEVVPHLRALNADETPPKPSPLRDAFEDILAHYNETPLGASWRADNPLFETFRAARTVVETLGPVRERHMQVGKLPAGTGLKAEIPWLPMFKETEAPWQAVYVFRPDMSGLYLTVWRRQPEGDTRAIRAETLAIAEKLRAQAAAGGAGSAQAVPEAPSAFFRYYPAQAVPADDVLEQDLAAALAEYDRLVQRDKPKQREQLLAHLLELTFLAPEQLTEIEQLLREKKQLVLEGPPGSGKTYVADLFGRYFVGGELQGPPTSHLMIVQFHQSYGYEDFVEGIRPETNEAGQLEYKLSPGAFKEFCEDARKNPDARYVMIVDEINRGNLSRIFGELLLLLEYRDKWARLAYGDLFSIPPNVYLIGTMNTTDRSLAQIDYALRRRFYFYRLMPLDGDRAPVLEGWLAKQDLPAPQREYILKLFVALNQRVKQELGEHFQVGHSYFMNRDVATAQGLRRIWRRAVMPLLEEYFYARRNSQELLSDFEIEQLVGPPSATSEQGSTTGE
jgi:MoxR-like ATPase